MVGLPRSGERGTVNRHHLRGQRVVSFRQRETEMCDTREGQSRFDDDDLPSPEFTA